MGGRADLSHLLEDLDGLQRGPGLATSLLAIFACRCPILSGVWEPTGNRARSPRTNGSREPPLNGDSRLAVVELLHDESLAITSRVRCLHTGRIAR